ncbi:MAG: hypothetical protein K6E70_07850 [Butyrivibrio sp.]|nr:hypothetical protein [Butyrivibrio sp.]
MKLKINCDVCDARRINESNYRGYEEILIKADTMIVDDRSRQVMSMLPFTIEADSLRSESLISSGKEIQRVNGIYDITPETQVSAGTILTVNGFLKLAPGSLDTLNLYEKIEANGIIMCPQSISGRLPMQKISLNGLTKVYPDDYVILDNKYKLDKYFPLRAQENTGYFALSSIYDMDCETDFDKLSEKNVKLQTSKIYLRKSHLEKALPLINIEAEIVEIPDSCRIVDMDDICLDDSLIASMGNDLYVIGDLMIKKESLPALEKLKFLSVDGTVRLDKCCAKKYNELNVSCKNVIIMEGLVISDKATFSLDSETLKKHPEGVVVEDCAVVTIADDIPTEFIRDRLKIRNCAKVNCADQHKPVISEVSTDVAFIGPFSVMGVSGSIFGRSNKNSSKSDVEISHITAEYFEL